MNVPPSVIIRKKAVAALLGWSPDTLNRNLRELNKAGFPQYDYLLRGYHKPEVEAWLDERRTGEAPAHMQKVNYDAL